MGIIQFFKIKKDLLLLFILVLVSFTSDFVVEYFNESRNYVWPVFIILQFVFLCLIFLFNTHNIRKRKILLFSISFFILYAILYIFILKELSPIFPNLMSITVFTFLIISINYFVELYNNVEHENLFTYPFFWINVAVLIYFSGNLFLTISYNIFAMDNVFQLYIPIHSTLNTVKNLLFAMAFIVNLYNLRKASLS